MTKHIVIHYKTPKIRETQSHQRIEIGPYDKVLSGKYNAIFWDYVKNGTIPKMMDEDKKKELPEFRKHHRSIQLLIAEIHKVEAWKIRMDKEISAGDRKKRSGRPPIRSLPTQFETIEEMVASDMYDEIDEIIFDTCYLSKLPRLPKNLVKLNCYHNFLTELPPLPPTLQHLDIHDNKFVKLTDLPPNLKILICNDNKLESICTLPRDVHNFICYNNNLKKLPKIKPGGNCQRGACTGYYQPEVNQVPCIHRKLSFVMAGSNPLESLPNDYQKCMRCGNEELAEWGMEGRHIQCTKCKYLISVLINNTPLREHIDAEYNGDITNYLIGAKATPMEVEGTAEAAAESSGDEDGMVISYDTIS